MVINNKIKKEFLSLNNEISHIFKNSIITNYRLENFLKNLERARFNILSEINVYNQNINLDIEKIRTIDADYKADIIGKSLFIYVPEIIPSYKNLKTYTSKRILLNIATITQKYKGHFQNQVLVYIKVFDKITNWDIDNKTIKPIIDALVLSGVIKDDNINKMFYSVKGFYSDTPHTEIYVYDSKNLKNFNFLP